jgi:tRNA-specific 2-thiouridylase
MSAGERIVVGISGGVDSAVAALRLLRGGFDVHGVHMTNWEDEDGYCTAAQDYRAALAVCRELAIPLHRVNFAAEYRRYVFASFLREHEAGRTPNPDVLCNRHIKFGAFVGHARRLGARRIATGHYAQVRDHDGLQLLKSADPQKDQTYFLHAVGADALACALFPVGDMTKAEVRAMACSAGLPNHGRPDSTGICFIGERPFRDFLARFVRSTPGPVVTSDGAEIGRHDGLAFHTLGQRSGLGIGGRADCADAPWYVVAKDYERNALVVVQDRDHPLLWPDTLETEPPEWIGTAAELVQRQSPELRCEARVRHRHEPAPCRVAQSARGGLLVQFDRPQWAPAPGQYVVFYAGERCLGGAVIESARRAGESSVPDRARSKRFHETAPAEAAHPL